MGKAMIPSPARTISQEDESQTHDEQQVYIICYT